MKNQKLIAGSAMMGFCLSCFAGFIGGAGLLVIFLRALIFGLIFGVLGWGVGFAFEKFLGISGADSPSSSFSAERMSPSPERVSNTVDITIADERLPEEEQEPEFSVTKAVKTYHGVLDEKKSSPDAASSGNKAKNEVPENKNADPAVQRQQAVEKIAETLVQPETVAPKEESVSPPAEKKESSFEGVVPDLSASSEPDTAEPEKPKKASSVNSSDGELDELPDLSEIVDDDIRESGNTTINDSDFASSGPVKTETKSKASMPEIKDTELLAQAIRTAIANDN